MERQARAGTEQKILTEKHRIVMVAETEPVRNGDTLRVTISGEPDLPALYTVAEDGTIRLPFVGSIKVAGLTAAQAREAIGKQLAGKKLGSVNQVAVTVTRPVK